MPKQGLSLALGLGNSLPFLSLIFVILKNVVENLKRKSWRREKCFFATKAMAFPALLVQSSACRSRKKERGKQQVLLPSFSMF
jgi:hypothetical protein